MVGCHNRDENCRPPLADRFKLTFHLRLEYAFNEPIIVCLAAATVPPANPSHPSTFTALQA
jgi:hypothetical protein